jgi:hypothetical protein
MVERMAGIEGSGDGRVVDLAAFRRSAEDRKLSPPLAPEARPEDRSAEPAPEAQAEPAPVRGGLVVEVGRDVWPGTSPLDGLTAKTCERDLEFIGECRTAALAEASGPPSPDDVTDGVTVLQRFLTRLGDEGLPLAGRGGIGESSITSALMGDGMLGLWKGEGLGASASHPARRVRSAAAALGLVRVRERALIVTRRGAKLRDSPVALWDHVVESLPVERTPGGREAGLLVLLLTAAGRAAPDRSFERVVNGIGERLRLNSPDPDFSYRDTLREAAATVDILNWAGHGRIARLELEQPRWPHWAGLHWGPASQLARSVVARLS